MPSIIRSCSTVFFTCFMMLLCITCTCILVRWLLLISLYSILRLNYITKCAGCHNSVCERERENVEWFLFVVTYLDLECMHP